MTLSEQLGVWQTLPVHTLLEQSVPALHADPSGQPGQLPPQSLAVSVPFITPSTQDAATQRLLAQTLLAQSALAPHAAPVPHPGQVPPPQSVPVSLPSFTPSVQLGALHAPAMHTSVPVQSHEMVPPQLSEIAAPHWPATAGSVHVSLVHPQMPDSQGPLAQSPSAEHFLPGAHVEPQLPPQSTSVSVPFCAPSLHVAAAQVFDPNSCCLHTLLLQSDPVEHFLLSPHFGHVPPPQSTSVSAPSLVPFAQVPCPTVLDVHCEPFRV
jgi:hypothetical protein